MSKDIAGGLRMYAAFLDVVKIPRDCGDQPLRITELIHTPDAVLTLAEHFKVPFNSHLHEGVRHTYVDVSFGDVDVRFAHVADTPEVPRKPARKRRR